MEGEGSIIQAATRRGSSLGLTGLLVETKENTLRSQRPVAPSACNVINCSSMFPYDIIT